MVLDIRRAPATETPAVPDLAEGAATPRAPRRRGRRLYAQILSYTDSPTPRP